MFSQKKSQNGLLIFRSNLDNMTNFDCLLEYADGYIIIQCFNGVGENQSHFFLEKLLDHTKDIVFYKNDELSYQYVNQAFADFVRLEKAEILNKKDEDLLPEELIPQCAASERLALEQGKSTAFEKFMDTVFKVSKTKIKDGILAIARDCDT